jgi:hypothetical protein
VSPHSRTASPGTSECSLCGQSPAISTIGDLLTSDLDLVGPPEVIFRRSSVDRTDMLVELCVSTCLVLATVLIHAVGLGIIGKLLGKKIRQETPEHLPPLSFRALLFTSLVVLGLIALHGVEIWGCAFFYLAVGALNDLSTAVYLSTVAYSTVGFDDRGHSWAMVVAIEGINGVILLGWSTAFFVMVITRLGQRH